MNMFVKYRLKQKITSSFLCFFSENELQKWPFPLKLWFLSQYLSKKLQYGFVCISVSLSAYVYTHQWTLTSLTHLSPGIWQELICSSSHGRILILSTGIVSCEHTQIEKQRHTLICIYVYLDLKSKEFSSKRCHIIVYMAWHVVYCANQCEEAIN